MAAPDALLLAYLVGNDAGYLLSIDAKSARLTKLELTAAQAKVLGVEPGHSMPTDSAVLLVDSAARVFSGVGQSIATRNGRRAFSSHPPE